ncbi:DUF72 domain-containing protein [Mucilaginibacter corticis]|uniref:DUF72 domain-containing protein n=1 Tax=Mucilaginibacter corticis TaxID=2597670 RepID=A0A556M9F0_9SPHI|nr:DUF72 domain-containing protein [Mucilaginibacter corticis]TSJ36435.1 DUF72 domain-containing protein [Mucilaginibacter corticis]
MQFGREEIDLSNFDHRLPADGPLTALALSGERDSQFKAYVGAPSWGNKFWLGKVYPKGTKDTDFLKYYAADFNAVELNATFYNIPSPELLLTWKEKVKAAPGFKFCPKFPQAITHIRRFKNSQEPSDKFYRSISVLKEHLGPVFIQLADNLTYKSFPDLKAYLTNMPQDISYFVELRNKKWYADPEQRSNLFDLLKALKIGLAISDTPGRRDCLHMELTTPDAFVRFVNSGDERLDFQRLDEWLDRLVSWKVQGLRSLYFFIHAGDTPKLTLFNYLIPKLNKQLGLELKIPGRYAESDLFL